MWLYPIYNWFNDVFFSSRSTPTVLLCVSAILVLLLPLTWKRWWAFTAAGLALALINVLSYNGVILNISDRARVQTWLDVPVVTVVALVLVTIGLQWHYGDRPRRRQPRPPN